MSFLVLGTLIVLTISAAVHLINIKEKDAVNNESN